VFSPVCHWLKVHSPSGELPLPGPPDPVDLGEGTSLLASLGGMFWLHKRAWKGTDNNMGVLLIRLVRTHVQIQTFLRRQRGFWTTLKRHPNNDLFGVWKHVFQFQGAWWKYCGMWEWWEWVKVWAWDIAWLQHECGGLILSFMVSSYGLGWALTGPLIQDLYGLTMTKRCFYPHEGVAGNGQNEWCYLFSPVFQRQGTLTSSPQLSSFSICLCLDIWQMGGIGRGQSKNNSVKISKGF
jgi:hypothetical protein